MAFATPLCHTMNSRGEYSLGYLLSGGDDSHDGGMSPLAADVEPVFVGPEPQPMGGAGGPWPQEEPVDLAAIRAAATAAVQQRAQNRAAELRAQAEMAAAAAALPQLAAEIAADEWEAAAAALPHVEAQMAAPLPPLSRTDAWGTGGNPAMETFPWNPPTAEQTAAAVAAIRAGIQFS